MYTWSLSENQASFQFKCRHIALMVKQSLFRTHDFVVCAHKIGRKQKQLDHVVWLGCDPKCDETPHITTIMLFYCCSSNIDNVAMESTFKLKDISLLQLIKYCLWKNTVPSIFLWCPSSLFSRKTFLICIHESWRASCKPVRQWVISWIYRIILLTCACSPMGPTQVQKAHCSPNQPLWMMQEISGILASQIPNTARWN